MKWLAQLFQKSQSVSQVDEVKSRAYVAFTAWGPDGVKHRESKLADVFPDVPEATRLLWSAEFKKIDSEIWNIVQRGIREGSQRRFARELQSKFPFMNKQALDWAWSLASYYAIHG
ncbi:MAG: hypothetical protein HZB51_01555 [Chloroflexi bacterium]|nr:hypothetical protein [Chloroflexota bacterium]